MTSNYFENNTTETKPSELRAKYEGYIEGIVLKALEHQKDIEGYENTPLEFVRFAAHRLPHLYVFDQFGSHYYHKWLMMDAPELIIMEHMDNLLWVLSNREYLGRELAKIILVIANHHEFNIEEHGHNYFIDIWLILYCSF